MNSSFQRYRNSDCSDESANPRSASADKDYIPFPSLRSTLFKRCKLRDNPFKDYRTLKPYPFTRKYLFMAVFSRLALNSGFLNPSVRWTTYKFLGLLFKILFKIFNRIEVKGLENVPSRGILYVNHCGTLDPLILWAVMKYPVSSFLSIGIPWLEKLLQYTFYMPGRFGSRDEILEKMIRTILLKNRYFAIWPEGMKSTPNGAVMQGYSGIIRLYSALNVKKDIIPLVPVLIRGSYDYTYPIKLNTRKITVEFLPAFYLNREWVYGNEEGKNRKSPRELADYIMMILARANGQKRLFPNPHIICRKKNYRPWNNDYFDKFRG